MPALIDDAIARLNQAIKDIRSCTIPEGGRAADIAGHLREAEKQLAAIRQSITVEETSEAAGVEYEWVTTRSCSRSYNTDSLLSTVMQSEGVGLLEAIRMLMDDGALVLTWKWTELKRAFYHREIELRVKPREIESGDAEGPHVGEVWTEKRKQQPKAKK